MVTPTPTFQTQQSMRLGSPIIPSAAGLGAPQQNLSLPQALPQGFSTIPDTVNLSSRPGVTPGFPSPAITDTFNPAKPSPPPLSPVGSPPFAVGGTGMLTPAQQTGKQVGDLFTKLLEEVPALQKEIPVIQEKIQGIDLKEDLEPQLKKLQARLHQVMVHLPKMVTHKAICLIDDPQIEGMATEVDNWARQTPDPAALAEINQPKVRPHRPSNAGRPDADELGDESEDNFADDEAEKPESFIERARDKAKTTYSNIRERISPDKSEDEAPAHKVARPSHRPSHGVESDDLDSMLRGSSPEDEEDFSPSVRRHVSHPSKDRY